MFDSDQYQLLDFGGGEKVERFGDVIVRRQTPSVSGKGKVSVVANDLRFSRSHQGGRWDKPNGKEWAIRHGKNTFHLTPLPSGQLGVFPEQADNWDWIEQAKGKLHGLNAINLFGYTGGSTMVLAQAGASVTHVDAAKSVVARARQNARDSGLENAPIRWIAEDALRFVDREIRRGKKYHIIVADPPSFGRGPSGETWKLERDLPLLLQSLAELTGSEPVMIMLSCHTPGYDGRRLGELIQQRFGVQQREVDCRSLQLTARDGRKLACGNVARWLLHDFDRDTLPTH